MHVDEMCDREVNFLLKRRGTAIIPADIDQAREMAKEQRAKVSFWFNIFDVEILPTFCQIIFVRIFFNF